MIIMILVIIMIICMCVYIYIYIYIYIRVCVYLYTCICVSNVLYLLLTVIMPNSLTQQGGGQGRRKTRYDFGRFDSIGYKRDTRSQLQSHLCEQDLVSSNQSIHLIVTISAMHSDVYSYCQQQGGQLKFCPPHSKGGTPNLPPNIIPAKIA